MSQKIQFRRGADNSRQTIVPSNGEPIWTTDTNQLFIGDGITTGGISAGGFPASENYVMVSITANEINNGIALREALDIAIAATPYGKPRSETNRVTILMPGAVYDMAQSGIVLNNPTNHNFIGFYGLDNRENVVIKGSPRNFPSSSVPLQGALFYAPNITGLVMSNMTLAGIHTGWGVVSINIASDQAYNPGNHKFNNLKLLSSGNAGTGIINVFSTEPFNNLVFASTQSINGCVFNNCEINGSIASSDVINTNFNDCNFIHQKLGLFGLSFSGTRLNNCSFVGKSGIFVKTVANNDPKELIFQNCYINGQFTPLGYDRTNEDNFATLAIFKDCLFKDAYIREFEGVMDNCLINSITNGKPTFENIHPVGSFPKLYNCTITNDSSFPSTISGIAGQNLILSHCRLNKNITGITQILGSTGFSIVNSNFAW